MRRYIALLRGVNISGKNKVPMAELKLGFESLGFSDVRTWLNSGNVVFSSEETEPAALTGQIEGMIQRRFGLEIPVFVLPQEELADTLRHAPDWWGTEDPDGEYRPENCPFVETKTCEQRVFMITIYVYTHDTMADWEIGHVTAELHSGRFFKQDAPEVSLKTVGISKEPVTSMGGLTILPDCVVDDIAVSEETVLLLPGGNTWDDSKHSAVIRKAAALLSAGGTVGAICGATAALARAGLLDNRPHTSNGAGFLEMFCPGYKGHHRWSLRAGAGRHGRAAVGKADHRASGCFPARYARSVVRVFQHRRSAALFRADADAAFGRAMIHAGPKHAERRAAGPCRVIS